jgi:uncharacterized membrane protein
VLVTNNSNISKTYNLELFTAPFQSNLNINLFTLKSGESKNIALMVYPLNDSLDMRYNVSLELSLLNKNEFTNFIIFQHHNKVCDISVDYNIDYNKTSDLYLLNFSINNKSQNNQNIILNNIYDINIPVYFTKNVLDINADSNIDVNYLIGTNNSTINLEYICNNMQFIKEINVPKKEIDSKPRLSGYLSLSFINFSSISFSNLINSIVFQIILVFLLVILILMFSTRYLKLINKKNNK